MGIDSNDVSIVRFLLVKFAVLGKRCLMTLVNDYRVYSKYRLVLSRGQFIGSVQNINLGAGFKMGSNCQLYAEEEFGKSSINILDNVGLNSGVIINANSGNSITIGQDVRIGPYSILRAANHNFQSLDKPIYLQGYQSGDIVVEDDVWIGANVSVLNNVRIGRSSIVGAGSVVTSDIPAYSIAAGVPARVIRQRKS